MEPSKRNNSKSGSKERGLLEADPGSKAPQLHKLELLIKKFAPVICFHPDEEFTPITVDWYLHRALLVNSLTKTKIPAAIGLIEADETGGYYLEPKESIALLRGKMPAKAYVHAKASGPDYTDLQYWFLYAQTGSASAQARWLIDGSIKGYDGTIHLDPLGRSNGIWERITVRINNATHQAEQVFFPQAGKGSWVRIDQVQRRNDRILLYAAKGSHTCHPLPEADPGLNLKFNLYSSQLEFCLQQETGHGKELDLSEHCELVSAPCLGKDKPEEPLWLHFKHPWGNPYPDYLTIPALKRALPGMFGKNLEFLLSRDLLDQLVNYLLAYFTDQCKNRTLAPKAQRCWHGEEAD